MFTFAYNSGYSSGWLTIAPPPNGSMDVVYMELVEGSTPNEGHELVSAIAPVADDFSTPTLAVRTDLNITGYQIGGVRPSLPTKGLVWGMVESGRMTSLQIYNGQAWEEVDGRIWTGSRWVPYYAYDILLLKDLYDIVGTDPTLDPIYTETGFWSWLQEAWKDMISRLDSIVSALGGSPSGGSSQDLDALLPGEADDPTTSENEEWKVIDLFIVIKDGTWGVVKGVFDTGFGALSAVRDGVSTMGEFFNQYRPGTFEGVLSIFAYEGEGL